MKRTFMIGVAAGALLAGVNFASAQGTMERQQPAASSGGGASMEQQKGSAQQKGGAEMKAQSKDEMKAQSKDKATSGQAQQKAQDTQKQGDQKADQKAQGDQKAQKQDAQSKPDAKSGSSAQTSTKSSASAQGSGGGGKVSLNTEQKTKIRETVLKSGPRVTNVNFSISVGTVVPRTVKLAPLPAVLVEINPAWRSYEFFIVNEEIVIVEPGTLKIITIINV